MLMKVSKDMKWKAVKKSYYKAAFTLHNLLKALKRSTKVSTLSSHKVNRSIKFDCEKSSLAFSIRLRKVVDQPSS